MVRGLPVEDAIRRIVAATGVGVVRSADEQQGSQGQFFGKRNACGSFPGAPHGSRSLACSEAGAAAGVPFASSRQLDEVFEIKASRQSREVNRATRFADRPCR